MKNLSLVNLFRDNIISDTDNKLWKHVEDLKWYWRYKDEDRNELIAQDLIERYSLSEIVNLQNFVVNKRIKLQELISSYYNNSPKYLRKQMHLDNEGIWDVASHIVGLGEVMYNYVSDHPEAILFIQDDYAENFEFGFDKAIYDIQDIDENE